jgi:hypothetical protein
MTRQETTGAKNNRHVKVVANANLDTYLKLLRAYNSVTASITRLAKPAAAAADPTSLCTGRLPSELPDKLFCPGRFLWR